MSLVMPFDESISITVESRCEGRREKMKAASALKLPEETRYLYYGIAEIEKPITQGNLCVYIL